MEKKTYYLQRNFSKTDLLSLIFFFSEMKDNLFFTAIAVASASAFFSLIGV